MHPSCKPLYKTPLLHPSCYTPLPPPVLSWGSPTSMPACSPLPPPSWIVSGLPPLAAPLLPWPSAPRYLRPPVLSRVSPLWRLPYFYGRLLPAASALLYCLRSPPSGGSPTSMAACSPLPPPSWVVSVLPPLAAPLLPWPPTPRYLRPPVLSLPSCIVSGLPPLAAPLLP
jgi:hypothetical protein